MHPSPCCQPGRARPLAGLRLLTGLVWLLGGLALVAACRQPEGAACNTEKGDCLEDLACHNGICVNPNEYCRKTHAAECRRFGACSLRGGECVAASEQDCRDSERCKIGGRCQLSDGCCSKTGSCQADEQDPYTHVERLADPDKRAAAVKRLIRFYDDRLAKDGENRRGSSVAQLLDQILKPLIELALSKELDGETHAELVSMLAATEDPLTAPVMLRSLAGYKLSGDEADPLDNAISDVVRAIAVLKLEDARQPLFELFMKLKASNPKMAYKALSQRVADALVTLADPAWEPRLIDLIARPINTRKDLKHLKDEVYWQTTAVRVLGQLESTKAIKNLIRIVLSPLKVEIAEPALLVLARLGPPAAELAERLLSGQSEELVSYARSEQARSLEDKGIKKDAENDVLAQEAHLVPAARILAAVGRRQSAAALLAAVGEDKHISTRALCLLELTRLPVSEQKTAQQFKAVYAATPLDLTVPPKLTRVKLELTRAAGRLFDAELSQWLAAEALKLEGEQADTAPVRAAALKLCLQLASGRRLALCDQLAAVKLEKPKPPTLAEELAQEMALAKQLAQECKEEVPCYLAALTDAETQAKGGELRGLKAAGMIGVLGDATVKPKLVEALGRSKSQLIRAEVAALLDHLCPDGDAALAAKLAELRQQDPSLAEPLGGLSHRLRARALR